MQLNGRLKQMGGLGAMKVIVDGRIPVGIHIARDEPRARGERPRIENARPAENAVTEEDRCVRRQTVSDGYSSAVA
jgi:hypothetical protein